MSVGRGLDVRDRVPSKRRDEKNHRQYDLGKEYLEMFLPVAMHC